MNMGHAEDGGGNALAGMGNCGWKAAGAGLAGKE